VQHSSRRGPATVMPTARDRLYSEREAGVNMIRNRPWARITRQMRLLRGRRSSGGLAGIRPRASGAALDGATFITPWAPAIRPGRNSGPIRGVYRPRPRSIKPASCRRSAWASPSLPKCTARSGGQIAAGGGGENGSYAPDSQNGALRAPRRDVTLDPECPEWPRRAGWLPRRAGPGQPSANSAPSLAPTRK
jgi:hypothetical protein